MLSYHVYRQTDAGIILMQAIARVNRVFKDKPGGLVVDYIGIANELKQALKTYTDSKGKGQTTVDAHEAFSIPLEKAGCDSWNVCQNTNRRRV